MCIYGKTLPRSFFVVFFRFVFDSQVTQCIPDSVDAQPFFRGAVLHSLATALYVTSSL